MYLSFCLITLFLLEVPRTQNETKTPEHNVKPEKLSNSRAKSEDKEVSTRGGGCVYAGIKPTRAPFVLSYVLDSRPTMLSFAGTILPAQKHPTICAYEPLGITRRPQRCHVLVFVFSDALLDLRPSDPAIHFTDAQYFNFEHTNSSATKS